MGHGEAIEHVREACGEGGRPAESSPSEILNENVNADADPYYVLGACNPATADRALEEGSGMVEWSFDRL